MCRPLFFHTHFSRFSLPQRRIESDAERCCGRAGATPAAFYLGLCRLRGILSPPAAHDYAVGGPFFFAATKIRAGRGTRCRHGRCKRAIPHCSNDRNRRNHSSLRQRRIESDADHVGRQGLAPLRSFTIYSVNYFYFCSSDYICSMERNGMVWFWIYI